MPELLDRLRSALADRYRIERELGQGGMATVYLAEDLKHHRQVAIKVLKPELAAVLGPARFLREIEFAARLNHPHILPLHDSGEAEGFLYYVMPYVEGESLRDRLKREKQIPVEDALQIAREVADALNHAHRHDVVHRDIKPENILLQERHAVVADFGIARAISAAGGEKLTATGVAVGTAEYMSPEQTGARGELDGRSDIYALGCVVHEMLAGQPPFTGATVEAVVRQHLTASPPAVTASRAGVPIAVAEAIARSLAKAPADRYSTVSQFAQALSVARPQAASGWRRSVLAVALGTALVIAGIWWRIERGRARSEAIDAVAVLPFSNLMGDPQQEYFVEAMQDALITELSQMQALKTVISRTSVARYRNTDKSAPQIAKELGVDALVEASVFKAGDSVRIQVQLIGAVPTEHHLWAGTFDGDLRNVLSIQRGIARGIADKIQITLTAREEAHLAATQPVDAVAYDAWARGWYQLTRWTEESLRKCIEDAGVALGIDSTYAPAYALTALCYDILPHIGRVAPRDAFPKAKAAASRALELDQDLADAHFALAWALAAYDWDWPGAEREFRRGLELNPGSAYGHGRFEFVLSGMGRYEEALAESRRAVQLSPAGPSEIVANATALYMARRYDDAIAVALRAVEVDPGFSFGYDRLGWAYTDKGMYPEAIAALEKAVKLSGGAPPFKAELARAYALSGRGGEARRILREQEDLQRRSYGGPVAIGLIHLALGERDEALHWLEEGYRVRDANMMLLGGFPMWDPLRNDPRFQDLLRRMHFPERR